MATKIHGTNTAAAPGITGDDTDSGLFYGTDQVSVSTAGTERFRVGSAGQLGVGGATYGTDGHVLTSTGGSSAPAWEAVAPEGEAIKSTTNSNEAATKFLRADGDGTCSWQVPSGGATINNATANELVTVASTTTQLDAESNLTFDGNDLTLVDGNVIVESGHGISFAATTDNANGSYGGSMGDELLHDYEYGTWTPTIKFNGGTTGQSYSTQDGRYTKVGNLIHVQAQINVSDKGSSTGNITMSGLPWLAKSSGALLMIQGDGLAYSGTQCWCLVGHNNAIHYWNVQQGGDGNSANWVYLTHAAINDGNYYISGSYTVAD